MFRVPFRISSKAARRSILYEYYTSRITGFSEIDDFEQTFFGRGFPTQGQGPQPLTF
jgi:hypothetical protein